MNKRPNLAAVAQAAGSTRRPAAPPSSSIEAAPPGAPKMEPEAALPVLRERPPSRRGKRQIAAHFPEDVAWQLRGLAVELRMTVQDVLAVALNDFFARHGKPEIAPLERRR